MADAIQLAVASDPAEASVRAAAALAAAARTGGSISLAGSNTPRRSYELLAAEPGIDWSQVHIWFGDERCVPPDDPALDERDRLAVAVVASKPPPRRITLTLPVFERASAVLVLAPGESKAAAIAAVLRGPDRRYPASLLPADRTTILTDPAGGRPS